MHKVPFASLAIACVLSCVPFLPQHAVAQASTTQSQADAATSRPQIERQPIPEFERIGVVQRSIIIVDDAQRVASESFGSFMGQVDGFFSNAGSDDDAVSNESWARIRIDGVREYGDGFELDTSVKVRAVLPRTERKLKLLISTEDDDGEDGGTSDGGAQRGNQNASFALRFIRGARRNSDVNIDIGARQRDGKFQYFGRLNTRYRLDFNNNWSRSISDDDCSTETMSSFERLQALIGRRDRKALS